ncbi:MAG: AAA family ATPase, partial [Bacteroidia bacterium]|nr:AAA family ATPase [Bacteroidia bacterium]
MKNQINFVEIKNFKTIKHVKFNTKKINLFVGKPNVGKSNLLEALSLLGYPASR